MASTNKTTGYELSQFIGTDKPSWMGDYNGDMLKIDTALTSINATATGAQSSAASAISQAQSAQQTANSALQNSNNNASNIDNIKNLLNNTTINTTPISQNTTGYFVLTYSKYIKVIKGFIAIASTGLTQTTVVDDRDTAFPMQSVPLNVFNLSVGNISTGPNILIGIGTLSGLDAIANNILPIYAYYDGANTIFYGKYGTSLIQNIKAGIYIGSCNTILNDQPLNYSLSLTDLMSL